MSEHDDIFDLIARIRACGERAALATVIGTRGSTPGKETMRLVVREDGVAKRIFLQSFGHKNAQAVREAVEGAVSSFWPASALQLHPDVTFYLDRDSASKLTMRDYYRRVRENEIRLGSH